MRIGIDFDNTLVLYDHVFHGCAVEEFGMPAEIPAEKSAIRTWFREGPLGERAWVELQGIVYGTRLDQADLAPGSDAFLRACRERGFEMAIISHKTEHPAAGPRVDLREAARRFLRDRGLLRAEVYGLSLERVFFTGTRDEKLELIARLRCDAFVDDLPEVFAEPTFPAGVHKLLYDRAGRVGRHGDVVVCRSWREVGAQLLGSPP